MTSGDFKTDYRKDIAIFQTTWVKGWLVFFILALLIFPFVVGEYPVYIMNLCGIAIIGALGLNILTGFTGQISLGHAAFIAIGAYTSGILTTKLGMPFWFTIPIAGLVSAFAGLIVGIPSLRLKGLYLAITTMAFSIIVEYIIMRWKSLTGGAVGMEIPRPVLGGIAFESDRSFYFVILFFVVLGIIFSRNLIRTKAGRAFIAIRDRDIAAEVIGVDLSRYKIISFMISSFYAGVAGSLYGALIMNISSEQFALHVSIEYVAMIIIGGMGSILGSIYGAVFMTLVPEILRFSVKLFGIADIYPSIIDIIDEIKVGVFGILIILFLIYEPEGIYGRWRKIKAYWKTWPFTY